MKKYLGFIDEFADSHSPIPCSAEQAALYASWLARTLKYGSITNYLSGLNNFLCMNGSPELDYSNYVLTSTLRGIRRKLGDAPKQAAPVLPSMLLGMFSFLTVNPGHVSWRAAVLCCFRGLLRKCQVTLSDSTLHRGDFRIMEWGMIITLRRTKTIQFRQRVLQIPIARCSDIRLCAVYWTERHFAESKAGKDDLAFRIPGGVMARILCHTVCTSRC